MNCSKFPRTASFLIFTFGNQTFYGLRLNQTFTKRKGIEGKQVWSDVQTILKKFKGP